MPPTDEHREEARLALVSEHIRREDLHDLDGVLATFGPQARYDDEPWRDHRIGLEGVRAYYIELLHAVPDLGIAIDRAHVAAESVIVEVTITGTHRGAWRDPATPWGRIATAVSHPLTMARALLHRERG